MNAEKCEKAKMILVIKYMYDVAFQCMMMNAKSSQPRFCPSHSNEIPNLKAPISKIVHQNPNVGKSLVVALTMSKVILG